MALRHLPADRGERLARTGAARSASSRWTRALRGPDRLRTYGITSGRDQSAGQRQTTCRKVGTP